MNPEHKYNCLIFDVDGTLVDSLGVIGSAFQDVIHEEHGKYFSQEELSAGFGTPTAGSFARFGFKDINGAMERYLNHLKVRMKDVAAYDGIPELLALLKAKGVAAGFVTSRNRGEIAVDECLKSLMKYFNCTVCADDTQKHKPDPEPLRFFVKKAGVDAAKCLFIGDSRFDAQCAKGAGISFALALWGLKDAGGIEADYFFKKPGDIAGIL